jgi:hypothetical protein
MSLHAFNNSCKKDKINTLLKTGVYLAERKAGFLRIMLYQINDFYVEVFFLKWMKTVIGFRIFQSTDRLLPYLHKVDIEKLMHEVQH